MLAALALGQTVLVVVVERGGVVFLECGCCAERIEKKQEIIIVFIVIRNFQTAHGIGWLGKMNRFYSLSV